jgi:hypothetical protein
VVEEVGVPVGVALLVAAVVAAEVVPSGEVPVVASEANNERQKETESRVFFRRRKRRRRRRTRFFEQTGGGEESRDPGGELCFSPTREERRRERGKDENPRNGQLKETAKTIHTGTAAGILEEPNFQSPTKKWLIVENDPLERRKLGVFSIWPNRCHVCISRSITDVCCRLSPTARPLRPPSPAHPARVVRMADSRDGLLSTQSGS